jgi:RNA polymerase sigma factor (sigma-70 family)
MNDLGLAYQAARKFGDARSMDYRELLYAAYCGLVQARDGFDESKGFRFSTYAVTRINGAILDFLREERGRHITKRIWELNKSAARLRKRLHRNPNDYELADDLGIPVERVNRWMYQRQFMNPGNLDALVGDGSSRLKDFVPDGNPLPDELCEQAETRELIQAGLARLPNREREVLERTASGETHVEIARSLGVSPSRISQLMYRGLKLLRPHVEALCPS